MPIKKNASRQAPIVAHLSIGFADPVAGTAEDAIELPGNAIVIGGAVTVVTPWNGTSATLKLGDAADDDRYTAAAVDLKAAGHTPLTLSGHQHTTAESLKTLVAAAGTATAGVAFVTVQYYVPGRSAFTQG